MNANLDLPKGAPAVEAEAGAGSPSAQQAGMESSTENGRVIVRGKSHMPSNSVLFERIIPILLIGLGVLTVTLILIAAGVLLGLVPFH
jgi:hypothetical protein